MQIKLKGKLLNLKPPVTMGIVNVTPDSFYQGARFSNEKNMLQLVEKMLNDGASIIDVGGYSTRPQAENISPDEEISRVSNALESILKKFPDTLLSVDTFRANVARHVVNEFNVAMINDISGGTLDNMMFETIADLQVAYVLMHTRGNPQNMQNMTNYDDVVSEVLGFLQKRVAQLHLLGVNDIVVDPGFGFAKTTEQNFSLLKQLAYFKELNVPILAGLSRKSMIYKTLNIDATSSLNGTTALNMLALQGGASILRVHDVKEAMEAIKLHETLLSAN